MNDKETNVGITTGEIINACYWHVIAM